MEFSGHALRAGVIGVVVALAGACGTSTLDLTTETRTDIDLPVAQAAMAAGSSDALAPATTETTEPPAPSSSSTTSTTTAPTTTTTTSTTTTTTTTTTTSTTTTSTTTTAAPIPLEYHSHGRATFVLAGDLAVHLPVDRYETVGFHESGHDGAFQLEVVDLADWRTLESRGRGTGSRTAADIVVPAGEEIRSPIDGTVIRAGTYTLYCDYSDNFVVIEPVDRPGWELKIFHFLDLSVAVGDTVTATSTRIGSGARTLPFESQVDEFTATPSNPHVHIEVIDTSIPDRPSTGGGC